LYGVSEISRRETETLSHRRGRGPICVSILIALLSVGFFVLVILNIPKGSPIEVNSVLAGILIYLVFCFNAFRFVLLFTKEQSPAVVQRGIGSLIRNIMVFQAAWCALSNYFFVASIVLILAYNAKTASQKFYSS